MTRAYDDIDAVTRLLEEKEKDLELTVQIGKELLTQNTHLENRVAELEQELKNTNENLAQLAHELHQKNELIGILTNDVDDSSENGKVFHPSTLQNQDEISGDSSKFFMNAFRGAMQGLEHTSLTNPIPEILTYDLRVLVTTSFGSEVKPLVPR